MVEMTLEAALQIATQDLAADYDPMTPTDVVNHVRDINEAHMNPDDEATYQAYSLLRDASPAQLRGQLGVHVER